MLIDPIERPLVSPAAWQGTAIALPRHMHGRTIRNVLGGDGATGVQDGRTTGHLPLETVLTTLPVALLEVG
jgi:hypothetical protein